MSQRTVRRRVHVTVRDVHRPGGTIDNSPPVHWRVSDDAWNRVPEGRLRAALYSALHCTDLKRFKHPYEMRRRDIDPTRR
jgi:hypothetical protein